MASKTRKHKQSEEKIKQAIVSGHRRGICDKDGNSTVNPDGAIIPVYPKRRGKTYVYRDGKMVEKKGLTLSNP